MTLSALKAILKILLLNWRATFGPSLTLNYPHIKRALAHRTRGRLNNKIEDCIGCHACEEICPVSCIHIKTIDRKSHEPIPVTSQESGLQPIAVHITQFDIDFGLCFQCGLCTRVCPTHCLTSTDAYEFSVANPKDLIVGFAEENKNDS